jgi:hypothetical protein
MFIYPLASEYARAPVALESAVGLLLLSISAPFPEFSLFGLMS